MQERLWKASGIYLPVSCLELPQGTILEKLTFVMSLLKQMVDRFAPADLQPVANRLYTRLLPILDIRRSLWLWEINCFSGCSPFGRGINLESNEQA